MICTKCGHDAAEGERYCLSCGRALTGALRTRKFFKCLALAAAFIASLALVFLFGNYFGKTDAGKALKTPDFIATIAEKLKDIAYFPVELEFTQAELNTMIRQNEASFAPMRDVKLTFPSGGGLALSGVIAKTDIKTMFSDYIPELIIMFLPDDVSVFAEAMPSVVEGRVVAGIQSLTVGGVTLGTDTLEYFGADEMVGDFIASALSSGYGDGIELTSLSIESSPSKGEPALKIGVNYYLAK